MTRVLACVVAAASLACAANRPATAPAAREAAPPILDRGLIFGDPEISGAKLSPDRKYLAFLRPFQGTRNVWVKGTGEAFDRARPVTADTKRPILEYSWTRDARYLLYVQDQGGDENFNLYAAFAATERFLTRHLGGRFQGDMPADVATRLEEITVDPKTVTAPKSAAR